jgi:hypothetical protein
MTKEQIKLGLLMLKRDFHRLYTEVYKKNTSYYTIEEMQAFIKQCNDQIGNREQEIANLNYSEVKKQSGSSIQESTKLIKDWFEEAKQFYLLSAGY